MQISDILELIKAAPTASVKLNRYGYEVNGERYRRVTTLLGGIPKAWLGAWSAKMVAHYAVEHRESWEKLPKNDAIKLLKSSPWGKRDKAGDRGTAVHNAIEAYLNKVDIPEMNEDETACAEAASTFLKERGSKILGAEVTVFNVTHSYAGTLDVWEQRPDGKLGILDWKTSGAIHAEHAIQQVAYQRAEFAIVKKEKVGDGEWLGKIIPWAGMADVLGVVHVEATGATLHSIPEDTERLWNVFRASSYIKDWQLATDSFAGRTPREHVYIQNPTVLPLKGDKK